MQSQVTGSPRLVNCDGDRYHDHHDHHDYHGDDDADDDDDGDVSTSVTQSTAIRRRRKAIRAWDSKILLPSTR